MENSRKVKNLEKIFFYTVIFFILVKNLLKTRGRVLVVHFLDETSFKIKRISLKCMSQFFLKAW